MSRRLTRNVRSVTLPIVWASTCFRQTRAAWMRWRAKTGQIVLQHAQPGKVGTYGQNKIERPGTWRFDANLQKAFRLTESKSLQVRFDATNIMNHPQPANPTLDINSDTPFGRITTKTGGRAFQGQLRLTF